MEKYFVFANGAQSGTVVLPRAFSPGLILVNTLL